MKKLLFSSQVILFSLFGITLLLTLFQLSGGRNPLGKLDNAQPAYNGVEEFDPSLARLNSLQKLELYCDSLYSANYCNTETNNYEKCYTNIVSKVVRKRFYHGYSYYGFESNYVALLFSKITSSGYSAVVIPDDILKYPNAACSQQSIVMMEVLKKKGFQTRKISFQGKKYGGHFCFEVFYNGGWHFYDTNMEPDVAVLNTYKRPSIAFLNNNPDILVKAYKQYSREEILDIFPAYTYGAVNKFPAPNAIIFQKITRMLSYTLWFFFLAAFITVRRRYKRITSTKYVWNSRFYFPPLHPGTSSSYYPGY